MRAILFLQNLLVIAAMIGSSSLPEPMEVEAAQAAIPPKSASAAPSFSDLTVSLKAATEATILFRTEKGKEVNAPNEEERKIPHLVLNRNGVPTPGFERTLYLTLGNLPVPTSGLYIDLDIETQHGDPDVDSRNADKILVWRETRFVPYKPESLEPRSISFKIVFQRTFAHQGRSVRIPADYYCYRITVWDAHGNMVKVIKESYAFLLENQWKVPLPQVLEATPGAAPKKLVVYFSDMIPFQSHPRDPETRIPRQDVERYIQAELIPAMVEAFVTQSNLWEMPWYEEWSNSRSDEDPDILSVALGGRGTWFHGQAPSLGHAMISIRVDGAFGEYANITDGIMSVFHHELFHNQQRNISLHFDSLGNIAGQEKAWKFFSEGTAVLASVVGQPDVQLDSPRMPRSYLKRANAFIGADGLIGGGLNKSFKEIPYHTALYWRFLYEKCGGISNGIENPATGMRIIRHVLETLYSGQIANINTSASSIEALPAIMDVALHKTPSCEFNTFDESLVHFTRAVSQLRHADGRCLAAHISSRCGFFDPNQLYSVPHAEQHALTQTGTRIDGSIRSSFGLDLVKLALDPSLQGKPLQIIITSISGPEHEFNVELWMEGQPGPESAFEGHTGLTSELAFSERTRQGNLKIEIDELSMEEIKGLELAITRMDTHENPSAPGQYAIQVIFQ